MKKKPLTGVDTHTPKDFMILQQLQDCSPQYCGQYCGMWMVGVLGVFSNLNNSTTLRFRNQIQISWNVNGVLTFSSFFYLFWRENTRLLNGKSVQLHSPIQAFFNISLYWKPAPVFWGIEVNILCDTLSSKIILQKSDIYQKRLIESQQYCTSNKGTGPLFIS